MPKLTEKILTLLLRMPLQIAPRSAQGVPVILAVPKCLVKPETVDLASGVPEGGQNKTQNLRQMNLSLGGGVDQARSLGRTVRVGERHRRNDLGRAGEWMQGLVVKAKLLYCGILLQKLWRLLDVLLAESLFLRVIYRCGSAPAHKCVITIIAGFSKLLRGRPPW